MTVRQFASSGPVVYSTTVETVAASGASAQSGAAAADVITIWPELDVYVAWGANPTATSSWPKLASGTLWDWVPEDKAHKLAFLAVSGTGNVKLTRSVNA